MKLTSYFIRYKVVWYWYYTTFDFFRLRFDYLRYSNTGKCQTLPRSKESRETAGASQCSMFVANVMVKVVKLYRGLHKTFSF